RGRRRADRLHQHADHGARTVDRADRFVRGRRHRFDGAAEDPPLCRDRVRHLDPRRGSGRRAHRERADAGRVPLPTGERGVAGDGGVNAAAPRRSLPLRGTDVVVLAMNADSRAGARTTPNASLVVECDGVIDVHGGASALGRFLPACPWLASRLRRPFPWGMLQWRIPRVLEPPPVRSETIAAGDADALRAQIEAELNAPFAP